MIMDLIFFLGMAWVFAFPGHRLKASAKLEADDQ
jgi:hypothetical protein